MKFSKFIWVAIAAIILSASTAFAQVIDEKGKTLIITERYNEAREYIKKGMAVDLKNPGWDYLQGLLHFTLEEYNDAATAFRAGIDKKSKFAYNHIGLARVYNVEKKSEECDQVITKVKALNKKNNSDINLELTTLLIESGKADEAKLILYKLRDEIPDNIEVWRKLAEYYEVRKVDELAQRNYEKVLELDPTDVRAKLSLGGIYIRARKFNEGLEMLTKAVKEQPDLAPAYKERGELYRRWGAGSKAGSVEQKERYTKATLNYEKYISLLPNDLRAQYRYAQFLYLSGNYEKAIDELNKAQTDSYVKNRLLGYSLIGIGKFDEGKAKLDEYFKVVPEEKIIKEDYEALGHYHMGKESYAEAIENYRKMLEIEAEQSPDNARDADDFFQEMATEFKRKRDFKSEMIFRQNILKEKEAKGVEIPYQRYFNLGLAAYRAKDYESAKAAYLKVTELKPDYESGWYWAGSCVYKLTGGNDAEGYPVLPYYTKVYELLKDKPVADFKKSEVSHFKISALYLALSTFNPDQLDDPTPEQLNCEGAMEYANKLLEVDPGNKQISFITDYCNQ
ncbi:MAG: tetratricopeptide repeat protein [Bacteroidia bacterium]